MLILTRKVSESLVIGDDVTVTVLGVKGNQVRLGVEAPSDVRVDREEIRARINAEKSRGQKHCKHGVILYGNKCLNCERESQEGAA